MNIEGNFNQPEKIKNIPRLGDLHLSDFKDFSPNAEGNEQNLEVMFNSEKLKLSCDVSFGGQMRIHIIFKFFLDDGRRVLQAAIRYDDDDEVENPIIESNIEKDVSMCDKPELRGIGGQVYDMMMILFQDLANSEKKTFQHIVRKDPKFTSRDGLSIKKEQNSEKWDEIFVDILNGRGYEKNEAGDKWTKEYVPQGKY